MKTATDADLARIFSVPAVTEASPMRDLVGLLTDDDLIAEFFNGKDSPDHRQFISNYGDVALELRVRGGKGGVIEYVPDGSDWSSYIPWMYEHDNRGLYRRIVAAIEGR